MIVLTAILLRQALRTDNSKALLAVGLFAMYVIIISGGSYWLGDFAKGLVTYEAEAKQYEELAAKYDKLNPNQPVQLPKYNEPDWALLMRGRLETRAAATRACHRAAVKKCGEGIRDAANTMSAAGMLSKGRPTLYQDIIAISEFDLSR